MLHSKIAKVLEVIVSSLEDAIEAEEGGADRLEVVRDLDQGGLTPSSALVQRITSRVKIPVRVMLRENTSMALLSSSELRTLCCRAADLANLGVDGLVTGFVLDGSVDVAALKTIAEAVPQLRITFHRAFDILPDPIQTIRSLKTIPQVDRILTTGGPGSWPARKLRLHYWQRYAAPEITILAGAGMMDTVIMDLRRDQQIREIHIGRAARIPRESGGQVSRIQVAQLKGRPSEAFRLGRAFCMAHFAGQLRRL